MLVEDDNNLREIYQARLIAEGYEAIAAKDGEEALAMAVKEKPDLIIADVMMPKISGFDMLDILRSTPETKNTKVIMMTALSEAEDRQRANKLGADRYLVKSQVTLEDVAKTAREVLADTSNAPVELPPPPAPAATTPQTTAEPTTPTMPASDSTTTTAVTPTPAAANPPATQTTQTDPASIDTHIQDFIKQTQQQAAQTNDSPAPGPGAAGIAGGGISIPVTTIKTGPPVNPDGPLPDVLGGAPQASATQPSTPTAAKPEIPTHSTKVIQPINDITAGSSSLNALLQEEEVESAPAPTTADTVVIPGGKVMRASSEAMPDEDESQDNPTDLPHPPGHVITPGPEANNPPAPTDNIDPNSVAL